MLPHTETNQNFDFIKSDSVFSDLCVCHIVTTSFLFAKRKQINNIYSWGFCLHFYQILINLQTRFHDFLDPYDLVLATFYVVNSDELSNGPLSSIPALGVSFLKTDEQGESGEDKLDAVKNCILSSCLRVVHQPSWIQHSCNTSDKDLRNHNKSPSVQMSLHWTDNKETLSVKLSEFIHFERKKSIHSVTTYSPRH